MKKITFLLISLFVGYNAWSQSPVPTSKAIINFETENHDFGNILMGTIASFEFKFKNTGSDPLILTNVSASCGCTTPEWSKEPVLPGKTGFIKASFNSAGRPGNFSKSITVTSNAQTPSKVLVIKGIVEKQKVDPQSPLFTDPQPVVKPW